MTLQELLAATPAGGEPIDAAVCGQVVKVRAGTTKNGKPYWDLEVADGTHRESFKVWEDSPAFQFFHEGAQGVCVHLSGAFRRNSYGLAIDHLQARLLEEGERDLLLVGSPQRRAQLEADWQAVLEIIGGISDPRLRTLCLFFLEQHGEKFRRAAAARDYHHARRGGLLEHTAQMLRAAVGLQSAYPELNWDLVRAGILFHDCGKLWENDYEPQGFVSPQTVRAELLGHIPMGIEVANRLWRQLEDEPQAHPEFQAVGEPPRALVRDHLLHLIAAHHGQREFGSPVTPRTPEAWMLHHIDNIDAKLEMLRDTYANVPQIAPGLHDRRRPLEGASVAPLPRWRSEGAADAPPGE